MTRFFVSPEELGSENIQLVGENASHAKVLRLKAGVRPPRVSRELSSGRKA